MAIDTERGASAGDGIVLGGDRGGDDDAGGLAAQAQSLDDIGEHRSPLHLPQHLAGQAPRTHARLDDRGWAGQIRSIISRSMRVKTSNPPKPTAPMLASASAKAQSGGGAAAAISDQRNAVMIGTSGL